MRYIEYRTTDGRGQLSRLDDLFAALAKLADPRGETKATSVRQPAALRRAAQVATELGMDESFTAAANRALDWMLVSVDETVDQVLRHVEMIASGVGVRPTNVA